MPDKQKRKIPATLVLRRASQILFFLILPGLFTQVLTSLKTIVGAVAAGTFSLAGNLYDVLLLAGMILMAALAGRFFCGWMCAFGAYGDLLAAIAKKLKIRRFTVPEVLDRVLKSMKYILLFSLVVFVWGLQVVTISSGVNPMEAFGLVFSVGNLPDISVLGGTFLAGTILLVLISAVSLFVPRFFCRYFCPTGALLSISSLPRLIHIRKNREKCGKCTLCSAKCPMQIPLYSKDKMRSGECIQCAECVTVCPRKNCRMELAEAAVAPVVAGAVAVSSITGLYYIGTFSADLIGPVSTAATSASSDSSSAASVVTGQYDDGTYTGSGTGFRGTTTVKVTVSGGKITDVELVATNDDTQYFNRAWTSVTDAIISGQSADVDAVSGATFSSNGIMEAVAAALNGHENISVIAATETTAETSAPTSSQTSETTQASTSAGSSSTSGIAGLADGVYTGTGTGFRGETQVEVTVKDGKITDITVVSYQDDQEFFDRAKAGVIDAILSSQDPNVDAVSGATYSSNGIMEAVANALGVTFENANSQTSDIGAHGGRR